MLEEADLVFWEDPRLRSDLSFPMYVTRHDVPRLSGVPLTGPRPSVGEDGARCVGADMVELLLPLYMPERSGGAVGGRGG